MSTNVPDGGESEGFDAIWSSDGVTRSFASSSSALPADLPYLFAGGQRFGPYEIVRPLGKGGMGQVYEAEESESGRRVAIKILGRGIGDEEERQRFLREGQLAASLSHPNCVYVFGTSEVQGFPVIAMELAPAGTLKDLLPADGRMPVAQAVDAILQLIAGLDAAAALGILHRDIKPSNAFVDRDGRVMIGDFGLSIATAARGDAHGHGMISGTPGFASPEQMRGEPLDVRSDIYAVGATLFYLLTGRPPVEHTSATTMLNGKGAPATPAIGTVRPDVPRRLASVIAKCLAVAPASRFPSYTALAAALEPFRSVDLAPAPVGRRLLAGVIDSYAASLPLMPIGMLAGARLLREQQDLLAMMLPSLVCSLLYYAIFEGHFGCGAGKALLSLRVVNRARLAPGFVRALGRAFVFLAPQQAVSQATAYFMIRRMGGVTSRPGDMTEAVAGLVAAAISLLVMALLFSTMRRRNGMAAVHDLASGTNVVLRPRAIEARAARARRDAAEAASRDGASVGPYHVAPSAKEAAATVAAPLVVEAWDARLQRAVWLRLMPTGAAPLAADRRDLSRAARVRWLSGRRTETECWDAFEAIPGEPLLQAAATPQPWSRVRHWLYDLALEISAGTRDGSLPPLALDRVWIGADDRARLFDWPVDGASAAAAMPDAQAFLHAVAARALGSASVPLPLPGRGFLDGLKAGSLADPAALDAAATGLLRGPAIVPRRTRVLQMGAYASIPALIAIALYSVLILQARSRLIDPKDFALDVTLKRLDALEKKGANLSAEESAQHDLIQTYVGERLREEAEGRANLARGLPGVANIQRDAAVARRALARPRDTSPAKLAEADRAVADLIEKDTESRELLSRPVPLWRLLAVVTGGAAAFVAALSLLGALLFGSGFTFRALGAALVTRDGRPASRVRALVRAVFAWSPIALYLVLVRITPSKAPATVLSASAYTLVIVLLIAGAVYAALRPSRALQDRLAGTWIVPR
ncbi:MAG TPA: protein kinase [Vicinamibacterales bacterium]